MAFLPRPPLCWCRLSQPSHSPKRLTDISGCLFFYVYFLQLEEIPSLSTFATVFAVCWERFEIGAVKKWYTEALCYRLMPFKCCFKERSTLKKLFGIKGKEPYNIFRSLPSLPTFHFLGSFKVFIRPNSYHWLLLSLTNSLNRLCCWESLDWCDSGRWE